MSVFQPSFQQGQSPATPLTARVSSDERIVPLFHGTPAYDPRVEAAVEAEHASTGRYWIHLDGRRAPIDTREGALLAYALTTRYASVSNAWGHQISKILTQAERSAFLAGSDGQYQLGGLSDAKRVAIAHYVNCLAQFAVSLRILAEIYEANGLSVDARPPGGISLANVAFWTSPWSTPETHNVTLPSGWGALAARILQKIQAHYSFAQMPPSVVTDLLDVVADAQEDMGVAPAVVWAGAAVISVLILTLGGVYVFNKSLPVGARILGLNLKAEEILVEHFRVLTEQCEDLSLPADQRQAACDAALAAFARISSMTKPLLSLGSTMALVGGVGLAGYWIYRKSR